MSNNIKMSCTGCKFVHVRKAGGGFSAGFQRICSRGVKNLRTGHAKDIGKRDVRCEHYTPLEKGGE